MEKGMLATVEEEVTGPGGRAMTPAKPNGTDARVEKVMEKQRCGAGELHGQVTELALLCCCAGGCQMYQVQHNCAAGGQPQQAPVAACAPCGPAV